MQFLKKNYENLQHDDPNNLFCIYVFKSKYKPQNTTGIDH